MNAHAYSQCKYVLKMEAKHTLKDESVECTSVLCTRLASCDIFYEVILTLQYNYELKDIIRHVSIFSYCCKY